MSFSVLCRVAVSLATAVSASTVAAQSGGFVMTLGTDTVQVEQFARSGSRIAGVIAVRAPVARLIRYTITLGEGDRFEAYEQAVLAADGMLLNPDPGKVTMRYVGDSVIRESLQHGEPLTQRIATPNRAYPLGTIPFGSSFLVFEFALRAGRAGGESAGGALWRLAPGAAQTQPSRTGILAVGPDSVMVDYFGQGGFTFRFDRTGRVLESDWGNTTYKVMIRRVERINAEAMARAWMTEEAAGRGIGAISPRDTVRASLRTASLWIDYSRPAKRGRRIWGVVVPWNAVWRLGADFATQFHSDVDLTVGTAAVPAGTYTLWMLPREDGSFLVINKQTGIFGTQYNPAADLVWIPLQRKATGASVDRLTIGIREGELRIEWDDAAYSVPLHIK